MQVKQFDCLAGIAGERCLHDLPVLNFAQSATPESARPLLVKRR